MQYYRWLLFNTLWNHLLSKTCGYFGVTAFLKYSLVTMRTTALHFNHARPEKGDPCCCWIHPPATRSFYSTNHNSFSSPLKTPICRDMKYYPGFDKNMSPLGVVNESLQRRWSTCVRVFGSFKAPPISGVCVDHIPSHMITWIYSIIWIYLHIIDVDINVALFPISV